MVEWQSRSQATENNWPIISSLLLGCIKCMDDVIFKTLCAQISNE